MQRRCRAWLVADAEYIDYGYFTNNSNRKNPDSELSVYC